MTAKIRKHEAHVPCGEPAPTRLDVHIGLGGWAASDPKRHRLDVSWTSRGIHATASVPGRVVELVFIPPFCRGIEARSIIANALRDGTPKSLVIGDDLVALPLADELAETINLIDAGE